MTAAAVSGAYTCKLTMPSLGDANFIDHPPAASAPIPTPVVISTYNERDSVPKIMSAGKMWESFWRPWRIRFHS